MSEASPISVATHQLRSHPITGGVVALCAYEVTADIINDLLDADLLPSARGAIERFTWGMVRRKVVPKWSPQGTVITLGVVGAALLRARSRTRGR